MMDLAAKVTGRQFKFTYDKNEAIRGRWVGPFVYRASKMEVATEVALSQLLVRCGECPGGAVGKTEGWNVVLSKGNLIWAGQLLKTVLVHETMHAYFDQTDMGGAYLNDTDLTVYVRIRGYPGTENGAHTVAGMYDGQMDSNIRRDLTEAVARFAEQFSGTYDWYYEP
jgi:hypothetical protein